MKFKLGSVGLEFVESHPSRGAWIEIMVCVHRTRPISSHPSRGAWIEMKRC